MTQTDELKALLRELTVRRQSILEFIITVDPNDAAAIAGHIGAAKEVGYWISWLEASATQEGV